jgi:hypothetical protein
MAVTTPVIGQTSWGDENNLALSVLGQSGFNPDDLTYKVWNYDPIQISTTTGTILTSGTVNMIRMPNLAQAESITRVSVHCGVVAVGLTAGQCFAGVYNLAGTRLAITADISGLFGTVGMKDLTLTSTVNATVGTDLVLALLFNGATPPSISACSTLSSTAVNGNLTAANARVADGPAAQTSLPATITMSTRTPSAVARWGAMS